MAIKLNIGGPKEPTKSLADELKKPTVIEPEAILELKDEQILTVSANNSPLAIEIKKKITEHTNDVNAANKTLTQSLAAPTGQMQGIENQIAIPEVTGEKYALLAEASDTLSQDTINQFNQRMRMIELCMDSPDLHNAMDRVITYCQEPNELRPFLRAEDISLFVKGARSSYAKVAEVKTKNRAKKSKAALLDESIMEELADIVIEI